MTAFVNNSLLALFIAQIGLCPNTSALSLGLVEGLPTSALIRAAKSGGSCLLRGVANQNVVLHSFNPLEVDRTIHSTGVSFSRYLEELDALKA